MLLELEVKISTAPVITAAPPMPNPKYEARASVFALLVWLS